MIDPTNKDEDPEEQQVPVVAASSSPAVASTTSSGSRRRKKAKPQSPPSKDMIPLHPHFQPGKLDVICSRGKFAYNSPGNCWFRTMVEEQMDNYANARTKTDKSLVVSILVNRVRAANPQGGFVKNFGGRWYRVSDRYSREKVGQQFRDLLHTKYRSSTKAKAEKRKRQQNGETPDLSSADETSSKSTRVRLQQMSPRPSPSTSNYTLIGAAPKEMPPLIFDEKNLGLAPRPTTLKLQPRYESVDKRAPDQGELQPPKVGTAAAHLDQGTMDLEYLDDLEPIPMGNAAVARASRNNSLNLMSGLQDSFPNIFSPPDLHQSLPPDFNTNNNTPTNGNTNTRRVSDKPADPFYQPWHNMSM